MRRGRSRSGGEARSDDLREALTRGHHANGNHMVRIDAGIIKQSDECKACPENLRCFLGGKTVELSVAMQKGYPCVDKNRYICFHYHGALCLQYDCKTRQVNDHGYWGYSVTTSRSIRWYLEALFAHSFIDSQATVEEAIKFFKNKKRRRVTNTEGGHRWEWFQC